MTTTKKKKYFNSPERLYNYMRNLKSAIRSLFRTAKRDGLSQAYLLEERKKLLTGQWEWLTSNDQAHIFGYWDALSDELMDALEFRYLIRGKWYTPDELIARKDGVDPSKDVPSPADNAHYVYAIKVNDTIDYRPY